MTINLKSINGHKYLVKAVSREADFTRSIRAAVYALWLGEHDLFTFIDNMINAIHRGTRYAWEEGAAKCGIAPGDMTKAEINARNEFMSSQYGYIQAFGEEIVANSKANKGKLSPLYRRAELWVNRYGEARNLAMQMACADKKLKWLFNPIKEHCTDCLRLDGRVYRASIWAKYDLYPRMKRLECGGWRCGCEFLQTDEPVTPGRPPRI